MKPNLQHMLSAIAAAERTVKTGAGGPFGACIVKDDQILAVASNRVLERCDPTAHAEMNAIRDACAQLATYRLDGAVIYSSTEPCPMCFGAIHWARIDTIIYGTSIEDVQALGFNELSVDNEAMRRIGNSPVRVVGGFMRDECLELLQLWKSLPERRVY